MTTEPMPQSHAVPTRVREPLPWHDDYASMSAADLLRQINKETAGNSLPNKTGDPSEHCDVPFRLTEIFGPVDMGNGPVFALECTEIESDRTWIFWIGWKTAIEQLESPALREWVNRRYPTFCQWSWVPKGQGYYLFQLQYELPKE